MVEAARNWIQWDPNEATRTAMQALVDVKDASLEKLLGQRLEFGTAGLRGPMGLGSKAMNDLVVIQTTQGVVQYLLQTLGEETRTRGIVIGYDHRATSDKVHESESFAKLAALVCLNKNIKVYYAASICMTPLVPFAIAHYKCAGGIMITASHNPKEDNGYKLYAANASQIIPPADSAIEELIQANLAPWESYRIDGFNPTRVQLIPSSFDPYFSAIKSLSLQSKPGNSLVITYTAMHGVGYEFTKRAFETFELPPFVSTAEQQEPDAQFPTVRFPNPEEGEGALQCAMRTADANKSVLILANDPDADRLAAAEKQPDGQWVVFTGNQMGALIGHWCWEQWLQRNPDGDRSKVWMLASAVSSKILKGMADKEGFQFDETLTGFKWLGNRMLDLRAQGNEVIFAFEEAIGFCCGDIVPDKDGVSAAAVFAQMAHVIYRQHNLKTHLDQIYDKYGRYTTSNSYVKCYDPVVTRRIFAAQRNPYPEAVGPYKILHVRDLTTGYDSRTADKKASLPLNLGGEMVTYYFEGGAEVTLRTSGTEPKIKWYSEMAGPQDRLDQLVQTVVEALLKPDENGLERR